MQARGIRLVGVIAVSLVLATLGAVLGTRLANQSPGSAAQPASALQAGSKLPAGVCPYSTDNLPVAEATQIQAKLVSFDVALMTDPYFPFKGSLGSSAARQQPIRVANYFWITAAAGNFPNDFPRPPGTQGAGSFQYLVIYSPADRCNMDGGYSREGLGAWPAWFDTIQALSTTTIK